MSIAILLPEGGFAGPVKRSVTIAGHQTSISLEPGFWTALEAASARRALPLSALVAAIDAVRISRAVSTISTQRGSPGCSGWSRPTATCWKPA